MNGKPPCKVLWYGDEWICRDQLQHFRFPEQFKDCFFTHCPGREEREPKVPECAFHKCDKPQLPGRKYCSDTCRKRSARWAYEQKKKKMRSPKCQ